MKRFALVIVLVFFGVLNAAAQDQSVTSGSLVDEKQMTRTDIELVKESALVMAVDAKNRLLSIKNSEGKLDTVTVSPAVKRLDEIKPGDKITLEYSRSLAFELREPKEYEKKQPAALFDVEGRRNKPDQAPGATMSALAHAMTKVLEINKESQMVVLKGPAGRVAYVKAHDPKNLDKIKVGDTVFVTYREAIAVGVEPAS